MKKKHILRILYLLILCFTAYFSYLWGTLEDQEARNFYNSTWRVIELIDETSPGLLDSIRDTKQYQQFMDDTYALHDRLR